MITRRTVRTPGRNCFALAMGLTLLAQSLPLSVNALGLSTTSRKSSMSSPAYSKLDNNAGPDTHGGESGSTGSDIASDDAVDTDTTPEASSAMPATEATASDAPATAEAPAKAPLDAASIINDASAGTSLTPVKIGEDTKTADGDDQAAGKDGHVLNATVDKNEFVPKSPVDRTDTVVGQAPKKGHRTKADKKEAFDKQVHDTGMMLGPSPLNSADEDSDKKVTTVLDPEKAELAELWDAALCRNQDIQFVVQKLMPTKDPRHTTAIMMKMLSTAMYGAMAAGGMAAGGMGGGFNPGMYMAQSAGGSLVMQVLNTAQARQAKKAALTETEAIMLYNMIRGVSNQVDDNYHGYRKYLGAVNRAWTDYQDLQGMVAEARGGQDARRQIECEYQLRKARRDIDSLNEDVRRSRQSLVDLSGPEAVERLDKQIAIETGKIDEPTEKIGGDPSADKAADKGDSKTAQTPGSNL